MIMRVCVAAVLATALAPTGAWAAPSTQAVLDRWLKSKALRGVDVGVSVRALADGAELASHRGAELFNPASGAKVLTTAAALLTLPPDTRWATTVHGVLDVQGVAQGPLRLVGGGDPKLLQAHVAALAAAAVEAGLTAAPDGVVVDPCLFDADNLPPAYAQKDTDAGYRPGIGAAASNFGAVRVTIRPGRERKAPAVVEVETGTAAVVVDNQAKTVGGTGDTLSVKVSAMPDGRTRLWVTGAVGRKARAWSERRRLTDPDLFTGYLLAEALARRGVAVGERVEVVRDGALHEHGRQLARVESADLAATIADVNTWSNNFMAEMLLKQLGRGAGSPPRPATWLRATERATAALVEAGLPADGLRVVNGSGLYVATHVAPSAMTQLLSLMAADPARGPPFEASLAVAGRTGTLARRLKAKATRGKVIGKTGTLDEVTQLSGYVETASGARLAFCVCINNGTPNRTAAFRRSIDTLILRLAALQKL